MGRKSRDHLEIEENRNANGKRLSRNMCEKVRRDRLKDQIHQLARKLPAVATCGTKMDKCSILRLAVAFLKLHIGLRKMNLEVKGWCPPFLSRDVLGDCIHENMDGFFLVVSKSGDIVCASEKITTLLGHTQFNLLGKSFYDLLHEKDHAMFRALFDRPETTDGDGMSSLCSLYLRLLNLTMAARCEKNSTFTSVHLMGKIQQFSLLHRSSQPDHMQEKWLVAICRVQRTDTIREISLLDFTKSEWISQHEMNGEMFYLDNRVSCLTGFFPSEHFGLTPYSFLHEDDFEAVAASHMKIMKEDIVPETIFRLKTANNQFIFVKSSSCVARDPWTKQAKFIVSLNQLLDEQEGQNKLAIQKGEIDDNKKTTNMFTDDIMSVISQALTGNVSSMNDEPLCENMDWGNAQFMTPVGSVIRPSTSQQTQQHPPQQQQQQPVDPETTSASTSSMSSSTSSTTSSRKRPAEDDTFFNLIKASIITDEEMDVTNTKCLTMSPMNSPTESLAGTSKSCCSSNSHSGSMLKSLLTDEHGKSPFSSSSLSGVSSPGSCPQSPRTPTLKSSSDQTSLTSSFRMDKDESQGKDRYETSFHDASPRPSTSDQQMASPSSPANSESSFVASFTEQLKQKHMYMEQSLLLQEATIHALETEVKKVKGIGQSSHYLQKICDRLNAIKENKAMQQAELQCLQNRLNQQNSSSPPSSSSSTSTSDASEHLNADNPSTLANMVFPGSESTSSDLGEIEPTFYPTSQSCKTSVSYTTLKKTADMNSDFSRGNDLPPHDLSQRGATDLTLRGASMSQGSSSGGQQAQLTYSFSRNHCQPFSQPSFQFSSGSVMNNKTASFQAIHTPIMSDQSQFTAYHPGFESRAHSSSPWLTNSPSSVSIPSGSTQSFYSHPTPLTTPTMNAMNLSSSQTSRIIDGDRIKTRNERIKIITSAYSKLPPPTYHTGSCATSVSSKNSLFTL